MGLEDCDILIILMTWMDAALYVCVAGVIGFGLMLSVRRGIESYKIGDWWGLVGQAFIILFTLGIAALAINIIRSKFL